MLVSLKDKLPCSSLDSGEFACVILRVKELYEAASEWQHEISSFTKLSLRGMKRRGPVSLIKPEDDDAKEQASIIGMQKVEELCENTILLKVSLHNLLKYLVHLPPTTPNIFLCVQVAMPREKGTKDMLQASKKFEKEFHEFLGKDYDGWSADKASYPESGSLVWQFSTVQTYGKPHV